MVKKNLVLTFLAAAALSTAVADTPPGNGSAERPVSPRQEARRPPRMSPAVYAPSDAAKRMSTPPSEMDSEERSKIDEARRRRFEIMVLINAYKIMPEAERAPLMTELRKRINDDFQAMIDEQKSRITKAETELQRLRKELEEREKNRELLVESELDRLLKMPMPGSRSAKGAGK